MQFIEDVQMYITPIIIQTCISVAVDIMTLNFSSCFRHFFFLLLDVTKSDVFQQLLSNMGSNTIQQGILFIVILVFHSYVVQLCKVFRFRLITL